MVEIRSVFGSSGTGRGSYFRRVSLPPFHLIYRFSVLGSLLLLGSLCQAQVVAGDDFSSVDEDGQVVILVQYNDENFGAGELTTSLISDPANGTATVLGGDSIRYTPDPDFNGIDTLTYRVCNGDEPIPACDDAQVVITVNPTNDPPIAIADTFIVFDDEVNLLDVQANDGDIDGDDLQTFVILPPVHGDALAPEFFLVEYTSDPGYLGLDSFRYQVCDEGSPTLCVDAWVYLEVVSGNQAPVALNDTIVTLAGVNVNVEVLLNDFDPDGTELTELSLLSSPEAGTATVISGGRISYTAPDGFTGIDSFRYLVCDGETPNECSDALVLVEVQELRVPDSFSPNGDGMLDALVISGLEGFSDNELLVMDRRGVVVYRQTDYQNDWTGLNFNTGEPVPEDVYFVQLRVAELGVSLNGTLTLRR